MLEAILGALVPLLFGGTVKGKVIAGTVVVLSALDVVVAVDRVQATCQAQMTLLRFFSRIDFVMADN